MCVTIERNSTLCNHRMSHTQVCKRLLNPDSKFNVFRKKCLPVLNSTYHFELCHDCRRFWETHGVSEVEAVTRTRNYRLQTGDHSPVSFAWVLSYDDGEPRETSAKPAPFRLRPKDNKPAAASRLGAVENSSTVTLWPTMPDAPDTPPEPALPAPQEPSQAHLRCGTAASNQSGTIIVGLDERLAHPDDFELESFARSLPLGLSPRRSLDLDKPLPRPPRVHSPMPGSKFDSRNPERDLPARMYYPRFI